tara:strand:- start:29750 stop:30067 length:318 start_codon:yes stop_codon:yes gene_type:complete
MDTSVALLSPDLARAARALAQVSADAVANSSELTTQQIRDFEHGRIAFDRDTKRRLRRALEGFGVTFIAEDETSGAGVRKKFNSLKVRRLDNWENEGGTSAEDDF